MKPKELNFLTGIESSQSGPVDISTGDRINITRESASSRVPVTYTPDSDDNLSLSKSGYDVFISKKGITSTSPVILSIIPLRSEDSETAVITVQRGLAKTCTAMATQVVLDSTGSFSEDQKSEFEGGFSSNFEDIVNNIFAAYKSKANYLSYLTKPLGVNVTDPVSFRYLAQYVSYTSSTSAGGSAAGGISVVSSTVSPTVNYLSGLYESESTSDWVQSSLKVNDVDSRASMTVLLQMVRNAYAKLAYDDFESTRSIDNVRTLEIIESESNDETDDFLSSIYQKTFDIRTSISEEHADRVFNKIAKDWSIQSQFSTLGINMRIQAYLEQMFGNITKLSYEQNIINDRSGGDVFGVLLNIANDGKIVQCIDPSAASQDYLEQFVTADQYYLMGPISSENFSTLQTRTSEFLSKVTTSQNNLSLVKTAISPINDMTPVRELLRCISSLIGDLFFTAIPANTSSRWETFFKFVLLLKSTEDNSLLNIIFRIMMLRDRLRNPDDYADENYNANTIKAKARAQINVEVDRLASKLGIERYSEDLFISTDNTIAKSIEILNFSIPQNNNPRETTDITDLSKGGITDEWSQAVLDVMTDDKETQYDYFHKYAKNLETSSIIFIKDPITDINNVLTGKVGKIEQLIDSNRDHRAFSLFLKTIFWFKNASTQNDNDVLLRARSNADTVTVSSGEAKSKTSGTNTYDAILYSLEYNPVIWSTIKGVIDKILSLTALVTDSKTSTSSPSSESYSITIRLDSTTYTAFSSLYLFQGGDTTNTSDFVKYIAETLNIKNVRSGYVVSSDTGINLVIEKIFSSDDAYLYNLNVSSLYDGNLRNIMFRSQTLYDVCDYITNWLGQTASLLNEATTTAANYVPTYGEKLSSLYTSNSVTNLIRTHKNGLKSSQDFSYFTSDYYRNSQYLLGMLNYAKYSLEDVEDSFVVVCGIPYGLIERMGGFSIGDEKNIKITLTFRDINYGTPTNAEITVKLPAGSFIDPASQTYTQDQLNLVADARNTQTILNATRLYCLSQDGTIIRDEFTDDDVKNQELVSTSILEYLRLLYGLDFSMNAYVQNDAVNVDSAYPYTDSTTSLLKNYVASLKYDPLISSRLSTTVGNAKGVQAKKIMKESLQSPVFDKILAIPVSGDLLKKAKNFYLCDVMTSIEFENVGEITTNNGSLSITEISPSSVASVSQVLRGDLSDVVSNIRARDLNTN